MTLAEALARLRAGRPDERRAALAVLAAQGQADVTPAVAACLHDGDPELVAQAEAALWRIWSRSGDPGVDALFRQGLERLEAQDWLGAVTAFGRVVDAAPAFAEGWNKRATARYLATHYASSIADCEQVVRLNPHHFGALAGQGLCHAALGQLRAAARCFRRALAIHPRLEEVRRHLARIEAALVRGNGHGPGVAPAGTRGAA
ncbi:MAG TPA: tetratricopeptide repeat protein [Methylomirabilota bacterium]|nr:tetratricopeptide repeat protein [Methylomirabilota bacterium]